MYSWALASLTTGSEISGSTSAGEATGSIESVIKVWLAADWLQDHHEASDLELSSLAEMIGRSDDWLAEQRYRELGADASVRRMVEMCGLRDVKVVAGWWSRTKISAEDLVRLGWCVNDGRAAGIRWTPWLLQRMAGAHDAGAFGVIDGVRAGTRIAYMNGWTDNGSEWQVNCLAIGPAWVLAVMSRYPSFEGLDHGAEVCTSVAGQLTAAGQI